MSEEDERRLAANTVPVSVCGDVYCDVLLNQRGHIIEVSLIGGSPCLVIDGRPTAWYENWIRAYA